ncbi:MAG TPA: peptidylprolyl isomerase [Anaerolineaceae bacterium]|nr:peptidylprolyl isomerase [Anaerolineaceae bacterium]
MKKLALLVLVSLFLVASCTPAPGITPRPPATAAPSPSPQSTLAPSITATISPPTPDPSTQATVAFTKSPAAECIVEPLVPVLDPDEVKLPPEEEADWSYGASSPVVTIVSYCNYQRSACRALTTSLAELQQRYPQGVRVVLRQYPQPQVYDKSLIAAYAAEAAGVENDFWEMNDLLYSRQAEWTSLAADAFVAWLMEASPSYSIDPVQLQLNMESTEVSERVNDVLDAAAPLSITATPVLFFNNLQVKTRVTTESLAELVEYFLLPEKAFSECPPMVIDPQKTYRASFETEKGGIVFELFPQAAPVAVNSFVFLARQGWYDDTSFFRVIPGFVVQGGDPSGSGLGGPGYVFSNEVDPELRFNAAGQLALTHTSGDMNGSQFFITYTALPELDGQFTIIGRVIEGSNVLNSLRPRNPESDEILLPADRLIKVTIEEE